VTAPKSVANLLRIAFYGGGLLEELEECEAGMAGDATFVELFGRMVGNAAWRIRRGGYQRGYVEVEERLSRPRGRMLPAATIASSAWARRQMHCAHDEFGEDTPDNRVLRAVVERLLAAGASGGLADETAERLDVVRRDLVTTPAVRLESRTLARLPGGIAPRRYRVIRFVARLLAEQSEPDGEGQGDWGICLVQDRVLMRRLFERFIYRFAQHCMPRGTRVRRPRHAWSETARRDDQVPRLIPDAVVRSSSQVRVIECKYTDKLLAMGPHGGDAKLRSDHLQQLFSYMARERCSGRAVSGRLVYPRAGATYRVATMLGAFPVVVTTLDLEQPWEQLVESLRKELLAGFV
jgi:5-methylcytosine-specific restriction endonuclease McrBC regulatory subunit McrC